MNTEQVEALRILLSSSGWLDRTTHFARALRGRSRTPNGLLVVGTPDFEPWHMAAHLEDESRLAGLPELAPTLVRWSPPQNAPAHLRIGIDRIARAGRTETLLVVGSDAAPGALLERVADARKAGASILALDRGDDELDSLAHEYLAVRPVVDPVSFDGAQHLVSLAAGEPDLAESRAAAEQAAELLGSAGQQRAPRIAGPRTARIGDVRGRLARLLNAVSGTPDP